MCNKEKKFQYKNIENKLLHIYLNCMCNWYENRKFYLI